jgi:hypothetical protein
VQSLCSLKKLSLFFATAQIQRRADVDSSAHAAADVHHQSVAASHEPTKEALKTVKNPCALYTASAQL